MYQVRLICVGKLKEKFFVSAQEEYLKRLNKFCDFKVIELNEEVLPQNPNETLILKALDKEYENIIKNTKGKIFVCDPNGKQFDSVEFSKTFLKSYEATDTVTFVIGSSYGLSKKIKEKNFLLSVSKMTLPHHLMRIFLEEQIYRAFCIAGNITYHK